MMKAIWFLNIIYLIFFCDYANAQVNLIQNGSFEIIDSCPPIDFPANSSVHYAQGWGDALSSNIDGSYSSPDLFNSCNDGILGVPSNWFGYQYALDGEGYAGIFVDANILGFFDMKFIQNELISQSLKIVNIKYHFNFHIHQKFFQNRWFCFQIRG
ncbi:MAG: hypothetical protein R2850_04480 [Bacteroidia bacterium]